MVDEGGTDVDGWVDGQGRTGAPKLNANPFRPLLSTTFLSLLLANATFFFTTVSAKSPLSR